LYVISVYATIAVINVETSDLELEFLNSGYIADQNRSGWTWKVRAFIDGKWGEWLKRRTFDVEPLNTDCAK